LVELRYCLSGLLCKRKKQRCNLVFICHLRLYAWWLVKVMQRGGGKRARKKESKIKNQRRDVQVTEGARVSQ
jgi:hypothetical protein